MDKSEGTEQKILNAARVVFLRKGMAGARMQEIANEAGINKALLHYYFRSKDKLFARIFEESLEKIAFSLFNVVNESEPVLAKLEKFIDSYVSVLMESPYLPMFVLNEMNQNPERMKKILQDKEIFGEMMNFFTQLIEEINKGKIRRIHPSHLILNLMALIVFPFAVRPMVAPILEEQLGVDYDALLSERKKVVYDFVYNAIKIESNEK